MGHFPSGELPFGPWHSEQTSAFFAPASTFWAAAGSATRAAPNKQAARRRPVTAIRTRSVYRKHEHAVSALEVELGVAAAAHGDVLAVADRVGDRHGIGAGAAVEAPEFLAGRRLERVEA